MTSLKIVALLLFTGYSNIHCSVIGHTALGSQVLAPAPVFAHHAPSLVRYTNVAPPSVLPFSAQVSTFSRHLHVFDAPYAAGVLPGAPAIVQRAVIPGVPHAHAHFLQPSAVPAPHAHLLPSPYVNAALHGHPVLSRAAPVFPGAGPAFAAPHFHSLPAYHAHAFAGPHLHGAVARSVHTGAPGVFPASAIAEGPLLG